MDNNFVKPSMNPLMARSPVAAGVDRSYCSHYQLRAPAPTQDGYCYLRMLHPASWSRVSGVLGPNPLLFRLFSVAVLDFSVDQLAHLQFTEVGPGLLHVGVGDGSALATVARSLSRFSNAPSWLVSHIGSSLDGPRLASHLRVGGSDSYSALCRKDNITVQMAVSREKPIMPVVYMAGGSVASRVDTSASDVEIATVEGKIKGISPKFDKCDFPPVKRDTVMLIPGDVAVRSGHVQVGGRGQAFALVVPEGRCVTAYRFSQTDLIDSASIIDLPQIETALSSHERITSLCGTMDIRASPLSTFWSDSYAAVDRYESDHRFALSHGTEFYIHRWRLQHHHGTPIDNVVFVCNDDVTNLFKEFTCVTVPDGELYCAKDCMRAHAVALTNVRSQNGMPASIILNDLVVTLGNRARVSFSMNGDGYRLHSADYGDLYDIQMIHDAYGYDCEFGRRDLTVEIVAGSLDRGRCEFPSYGIVGAYG